MTSTTPTFRSFLSRVFAYIPEGSASRDQVRFLTELVQENRTIKSIAETGFNTGVSSRAFLRARPDTTVVSFDIGQHLSVRPAKAVIDRRFPGRHELVIGDSTTTLPAYARAHPEKRFDLILIDGGHSYEVAKADLFNFRAMADNRTIVIMDDLTPWSSWGVGPTKVWDEAVDAGIVAQAGLYKNGRRVQERAGRWLDRVWAVGYYRSQNN